MPIDKSRYPPTWNEISLRIRQRDNFTCQHCGATQETAILTAAHLDHDETNWQVTDDRLLTLCAGCHLTYDRGDNEMRKKYGKTYRDNQLDLFNTKTKVDMNSEKQQPNKVTFVIGPPASGKTTYAKQMAKGKNTFWINAPELNTFLDIVQATTDLVVVEGVNTIEEITPYLGTSIRLNSKGKPMRLIDRPELIITSQVLEYNDIPKQSHIQVVDCDLPF